MKPVASKLPAPKHLRAFSLVEIVIAMAVFSISILGVVGLLSVSLGTNQVAGSDTAMALMTETTTSLIKSQPFSFVATNGAYYSTSLFNTNGPNGKKAALYFDASGRALTYTNSAPAVSSVIGFTNYPGQPRWGGTPTVDSVFGCVITTWAAPLTYSTNTALGTSTNEVNVQLKFYRALNTDTPLTNQLLRTVNLTVGNYD